MSSSDRLFRTRLADRAVVGGDGVLALDDETAQEHQAPGFAQQLHSRLQAFAEQQAPEIISAIRGLERLVFKTDSSISRGGCLLESAVCSADATIETQIESLREFLEEQPTALPPPDLG